MNLATATLVLLSMGAIDAGRLSKADKDGRASSESEYSGNTNQCEGQGSFAFGALGLTGHISCKEAAEGGYGQSPADVSVGYVGNLDTDVRPNTVPFHDGPLCPVNVHFHYGTEHRSEGEYDESYADQGPTYDNGAPAGMGMRCGLYDDLDDAQLKSYEFEHCVGVVVGETYEIHWPHGSGAVGAACGDIKQYQTPFRDGLFCGATGQSIGGLLGLGDQFAQAVANNIGVQGQVFTVVNDDVYDYANLIDGMVLDEANGLGTNITRYTGSTTGDHFDSTLEGERCDDVGPATWHVDRTCRLISAWSMDQMCLGIKNRAGMKRCGSVCDHMPPNAIDVDGCCFPDTKPHGSRDIVVDDLAANNQVGNEFGNEIPALVY